MPPLPKPGAAPKGTRQRSTGTRERASKESSSAPQGTASSSRKTKADVLQGEVARMYTVLGVMIRPFGRFYPAMNGIGENFVSLSDEAAEAWMVLAAKDKKVLEALESIMGASAWGGVIGIHLAIFASALPGGDYISQMTDQEPKTTYNPMMDEFYRQGKAMGLSDEEIQQAAAMATGGGGMPRSNPSDPVTASEPSGGGSATATRSGIVTPEELGVTQRGPDNEFPTDASPPNGRG